MTFSILGIDFEDIKNVFNYVNAIYKKGIEYANKDEILANDPVQQLKQIMSELKDMSKQFTNFVSHQDEKMDQIVKTLLNDIEVIGEFQSVRNDFVHYIENVDYWFNNGIDYKINEGYSEKTLQNFVNSVLWRSDNIDHVLHKAYKLIFPGVNGIVRKSFLLLALENTQKNYERLCDNYISPQQKLYYTFMVVIRTELKAFMTVTQAYTIQSALDHVNYTHEYKVFKQTFYERLTNYFESFIHYTALSPADVRRCDVKSPVIGKNIFQMDGLFQVIVSYELLIKQAVYPQFSLVCGGCEEISNNKRMKFMIYNCKSYKSVYGCITPDFKPGYYAVRFSSFVAESESFGHRDQCYNKITGLNRIIAPDTCYNDVCVCSVSTTDVTYFTDTRFSVALDPPKINKISVEPQYSDITNNMIVVGVKFILHDDAIHLQIQQSKIGEGGAVVDEGSWKPVNVDHNNKTINVDYQILFDRRSRLYLDDVMAHPNFVVTGVKFKITKDGSGFELHIHSTEYNHKTGQLGSAQKWYGPGEHPVNQSDYQRNRIEITLNDPDDSSTAHDYYPDPQTNKFIQFQHSSIKKDAGFHTVPFFDGQPVETQMKFPLSGIGLFHRGRDGFGGYIAPRLITYNVSWFIESSFNNWQKLRNMYKDCGLEVPVNVTVFKESVDCEILQQIANGQVDNQNMSQINRNNTFYSQSQSQEIYGHVNEWKQKTEKRYNEKSKNTIHKKKSPCLPKHLTAPSVTLV